MRKPTIPLDGVPRANALRVDRAGRDVLGHSGGRWRARGTWRHDRSAAASVRLDVATRYNNTMLPFSSALKGAKELALRSLGKEGDWTDFGI